MARPFYRGWIDDDDHPHLQYHDPTGFRDLPGPLGLGFGDPDWLDWRTHPAGLVRVVWTIIAHQADEDTAWAIAGVIAQGWAGPMADDAWDLPADTFQRQINLHRDLLIAMDEAGFKVKGVK